MQICNLVQAKINVFGNRDKVCQYNLKFQLHLLQIKFYQYGTQGRT